jgi:hypothetical protein
MNRGHAVAQLVEAQRYKLEGRGFDVSVTDKITNLSTGVGFLKLSEFLFNVGCFCITGRCTEMSTAIKSSISIKSSLIF